jgi:hypothetical protein
MSCKNCKSGETRCCAKQILDLQQDFLAQQSLVQEVIKATGHFCIFLPKFHCELNFIEFFWGAVKRYLCENCDYTFSTLQANLPVVLASVTAVPRNNDTASFFSTRIPKREYQMGHCCLSISRFPDHSYCSIPGTGDMERSFDEEIRQDIIPSLPRESKWCFY